MPNLNDQIKPKSFQLNEGKTSIKQIGLIVLVALFFIGLMWLGGWGVNREIEKNGNGSIFQKELSAADKELKLQEEVSQLVKTKDFNKCDEIKDELYKTVCVNNIALNLAKETRDISYCQKIDDKLIPKADCEGQIIFAKSFEKEDIGICKETTNQELQKQCEASFYSRLALKKDDIKICEQAMEKDKAEFCYNNFLLTKNFIQNHGNFNCSLFRGKDIQSDCGLIKDIVIKKEATQNLKVCAELKTSLFLPYCFSNSKK